MRYGRLEAELPKFALWGALSVFVLVMFPLLKPYPFSDDWSYLAVLPPGTKLTFAWVFGLHNDHRIPIQKLLHYLLLKFSGGDFRVLMLLNMAFAAMAAWCWMRVARMLRDDRASIGDAVIPLILLSGGFNAVSWSFSFQFVSSIAFVSVAAWAVVSYLRGRLKYGIEYGFLLLTLCAWCGANGIISAAVLGTPLLVMCAVEHRTATRARSLARLLSTGVWVLTLVGLVLTWKPSGATSQSEHGMAQQLAPFVFGMIKSWMGVFASTNGAAKLAVTMGAIGVAVALGVWSLWRRFRMRERHGFETLVLLAILGQSLLTVAVVAISRAVAQPWTAGLELHYGFLTTLIPISAWVIVAARAGRRTERALSALIVVAAVWMYYQNTSWRIHSLREGYPKVAAAQAALLSERDAKVVANQHIREYYHTDDAASREVITGAIPLLRQVPLWREGPDTPKE